MSLCKASVLLFTATFAVIIFAAVLNATPPNVLVNHDGTSNLQNEEQIWVSPNNSNIVIADWRDWRLGYRRIGVGVSTDGGATWSDSLLTDTPFIKHSDPILVGDRFGNFYLNALNFGDNDFESIIVVYKSTDDGVSWTGPVWIGPTGPYFEDKQFSACDRTGGTYDGNYYVSWTRFPNPTQMMFARSTDGCASFEPTILVGPAPAGQFSIPIVDADGDVHVFWQSGGIRHVVSSDGGATFTSPVTAFSNNLSYGEVDGGVDVYGMPNGDCDISDGPYDNTIYIAQCQYNNEISDKEVTVRKSTDNGQTWSTRVVVNDDPTGNNIDQFHPWLVVNDDGVVLIIFYDQRDDPSHFKFNSYFSASFDGGETYIRNMRISDASIDPSFALEARQNETPVHVPSNEGYEPQPGEKLLEPRAGLFAEYIGIHSNHDTINTIWTDTRNGNQDAYSARFMMPFFAPRLYLPDNGDPNFVESPSFRWSTCWHESDDSYRLEISTDSTFAAIDLAYDALTDNNFTLPVALDTNFYYWRVKAFRTLGDSTDYSEIHLFGKEAPPPIICGDADGSEEVDISDAVYLIAYIFGGGPAPDPLAAGDPDCSGAVDISDAVYLIAYIFNGGPAPCEACP